MSLATMGDDNMTVEAAGEKKAKKEFRQRKKKLLNQLRDQMEFYFSDANVTKSRFMAGLMANGPYVNLDLFIEKFNRIRLLTDDIELLKKAINNSSLLELSEDRLKVRRKGEVQEKQGVEECTIYVENVPTHADHTWLRDVFSQYGAIDYVSIPRFKCSSRPKGFAFVEFQKPEMATLALQSFGVECKIPADIDPAELQSIRTFQEDNQGNEGDNAATPEDAPPMGMEITEEGGKKRKLDEEEASNEAQDVKVARVEDEENDDTEAETVTKTAKKKKRKRNKKVKEENVDSIHLKVMAKKEWRQLRNRYLNMQKNNMKALKMIDKSRKEEMYRQERSEKYTSKYTQGIEASGDHAPKSTSTEPQFTPNVIIKISFEEPPQDQKKLRETIRQSDESVVYVDCSATEKDVYVRFCSEASAAAYKSAGRWSRMEVIGGTEEQDYWRVIRDDWASRQRKRNKTNDGTRTGPSQERGREKILQKAFRESLTVKPNHIVFED